MKFLWEKFKSYKDFYDKWYNKHNCNAMYNNWMHSCQQKEDLFSLAEKLM